MSINIPKEETLNYAKTSAIIETLASVPGTETWKRGKMLKTPIKIYDINGELLFHDYPVKTADGAKVLGHVRAAARKDLGAPVIAHELGARQWNFNLAVERLKPIFCKKYPNVTIKDTKLVCYSYPKLGVMFQGITPTREFCRQIYDVASLKAVPEKLEKPEVEGFYAWSYLDSLKESSANRLRKFDRFTKKLADIPEAEQVAIQKADYFKTYINLSKYGDIVKKLVQTKQLQYCSHYSYTETRSHHCFVLQGQQVDDYCAVATCQMILCYYRYYYTQDQIAPKLGYSAGSGCPSDQSAGYKTLTCNHLDAAFDSTPSFAEAKAQIDALHPFKTGIAGHARACAGYSSNILTGVNRLYIYDPWPWNADFKLAGTVTWEDWDSPIKTNFVTTKLTCP